MVSAGLDGDVAIVTGASSGIGEATAHVFAREGATVVLAARRRERLETIADDLAAEYDADTHVVPTDVTVEAEVESLVDATVEAYGGVDVLVNNAGLGRSGDVESLETAAYRQMMDVNCDGAFFATRAALPHLREADGNLVFVGSFAGQYPRPSNPVYAATKWWLRGFAHSVEAAYGDDGVAVTVVNPTEVRTEFGSEDGDAFEEVFEPDEVTEPVEIAEAIAFAARQEPPTTTSEIDVYRRDKFGHI
ncbi:probable oxidoreductase (short-chain dehydrogenase family) [Halobacterium hubeiense]|uniref:Probable oxidoreductase (Short-chain dehydrogenase family) n=1 Tax=Halobacterium hubeiense TaxID=1407499 RepID=A0A0U5H0W4_9EURY|nr:SDR family oxidoreductase [Halobacterium hubeiense]CQH52001.1 probable oxidoreductase (short-chain dehydrogenase family) [Halobacterium hubeiense]